MPTPESHEADDIQTHLKSTPARENTLKALERAHALQLLNADNRSSPSPTPNPPKSYTKIGGLIIPAGRKPDKIESREDEEKRLKKEGAQRETRMAEERAKRLMEEIEGREEGKKKKKRVWTRIGG
ncbi:hypothetical protein HK097_010799, partial [Rhizophlyctis rosea]